MYLIINKKGEIIDTAKDSHTKNIIINWLCEYHGVSWMLENGIKATRKTNAKKYQEHKEQARAKAQAIQIYQFSISWGELAEQVAEFERLAKKYGLVKEFRENGII